MSQKPESFLILVCKGILRDRTMRRRVLSWIVMAALVILGLGASVLDEWLAAHPLLFLLYWGICLWLTLTCLLLALYDMLAVRNEAIQEKRKLRSQFLGEEDDKKP